jgi:hypothetical protein
MDDITLLEQIKKDKDESRKFKERRFNQWNDNYLLFRDKITTNRLTQRQSVNIPIVRETIQTWISKIDEPPLLTFESRSKDNVSKDGEIVLNELWNYYYDKLKLDLVDNLDKKIVGLQGRSFKIWGFSKNEIFCDLIDPYDIEVTSQMNPLDLNSANNVIRTNIFKPLREILANDKYEKVAKNKLKIYLDSKEGLIKQGEMNEAHEKKVERLNALGAYNYDDYRASDVMVETNESYKLVWSEEDNQFIRHKIVTAADMVILYNKPLKEAIGIDFLPIVTWAEDPDLNDLWCDGKADSVRTINKVINTYISQDLENRSLRNFGMYFFDTKNGSFVPKAFDPKPFGMYGVPGNPQEMIQQMKIEPLADTNQTIVFLKDLIQSSVAQTPTERGVDNTNAKTLGEIQLNLQQSTGINEVGAKNYRRAWKESGEIFYALLNENSSGQITLYKKGADGEYRAKTIFPTDWQNPKGYECKVVMTADKDKEDQGTIQKLGYIMNTFQNNPIALNIAKRKELELLDWTPDEIEQVMSFEDQQIQQMQQQPGVDPNNPQPTEAGVVSPLQKQDLAK